MKEKKKGSPLIALSVVLVLLIYGAAGFGVYKFKDQIKEFVGIEPVLSEAAQEVAANDAPQEPEEAKEIQAPEAEPKTQEPAPAPEQSEEAGPASETSAPAQETALREKELSAKADFPITPEFYASSGGKFKTLGSGEQIYIFSSGEQAESGWVEDGGKYYYIDYSGCLMKDNFTEEGFCTGSDGSWDNTVPFRTDNAEPLMDETYGTDPKLTIELINENGFGHKEATLTYSFGYSESFMVVPMANSVYLLTNEEGDGTSKLMSVSEDRKTIRISGYGETAVFELK